MSESIDPRTIFTPDRPVQDIQLFAGRIHELERLVSGMTAPGGRQIALVGERGVGKTSLVKVAASASAQRLIVVKQNCPAGATFGSLWSHAFQKVTLTVPRKTAGFKPEDIQHTRMLSENCPPNPGPGDVLALLSTIRTPSAFIFDEFDRLSQGDTTQNFADLIKGLTDEDVPVSIVLVGVADNVTDLFDAHASVERSLATIALPRMKENEIMEIPAKGGLRLGLEFEDEARNFITSTSRGFPHFAHLLSLHAVILARKQRERIVTLRTTESAMSIAVNEADQALIDRYTEAIDSPRKDAQFKHLLTACALVPTDFQGYFRPSDLVAQMSRILGRQCEVSSFSKKLSEFCNSRGHVLTRRGKERRHRYRFSNPMMESYALIRGLVDGIITEDDLTGDWTGEE